MATKSTNQNSSYSYFKILGRSSIAFVVIVAIVVRLIGTYLPAIILFENILNHFHDYQEFNQKSNKFLKNNYGPVDKENINVQMNIISGKIPHDLSGLFMHVGPNQIPSHIGRKKYHLFDGHGMIHSVRINLKSAYYSNQWVTTPRYSFERKLKADYFTLSGELTGIIGLLKAAIVSPIKISLAGLTKFTSGTANTALLYHNKKIYALHEGSLPFVIEWVGDGSIRGAGYETFNSKLSSEFTAHPKIDPTDNKVYFNGYDLSGGKNKTYYTHGSISDSNLEKHMDIKSFTAPSMSHDMAITQNYVVLIDNSLNFSPEGIINGHLFELPDTRHLRLGILPKNATSDETIWFTTDKAYAIFHTMNAWEETHQVSGEIEVVYWGCVSEVWDDSLEDSLAFLLTEFRLGLTTGKVTTTSIPNYLTDFPRVHPNYVGQPSQYGYSGYYFKGEHYDAGGFFFGVMKIDLFSKKVIGKIEYGVGRFSPEIGIIPKSKHGNNNKSDDVYLAAFIYVAATQTSEWVVYDGTTMVSEPVLRLEVPARVPFGFHSEWINEKKLQEHMASLRSI